VPDRQIIAMGGFPDGPVLDRTLALSHTSHPRLLWVGTASREDPEQTLSIYSVLRGRAEVSHLEFFPWPPPDVRRLVLGSDIVLVGGGSTANMLAIWRIHGFDELLREAWGAGVVLAGWSAGMICWYEAGVTDSFGPQLAGLENGLGFLPGSACPHYDGEELRRPMYRSLVGDGFPTGVAADDGTALHYVGTELVEAFTARPGSRAYRVERVAGEGVEVPIETRVLA
jgi:peptidase E